MSGRTIDAPPARAHGERGTPAANAVLCDIVVSSARLPRLAK